MSFEEQKSENGDVPEPSYVGSLRPQRDDKGAQITGMDILIAELPIAANRKPDWTAARKALAEMTDKALEDLAFSLRAIDAEDAPASEVRTALSEVIDHVEDAISDGSRELSAIGVPGWLIYVTGGASRGDPPTELFEDFLDLDEAGLSAAAGFHPSSAAEKCSAEAQAAGTPARRSAMRRRRHGGRRLR